MPLLRKISAYSKRSYTRYVPIRRRISPPKTNENLFNGHLYTEYAYLKTELESQGDDRSLERHCGQGNRPMSFRGVKRRGNPLNRNKNRLTIATTALALAPTTAQRICAISSSKDKNSCHSCAKLSAWWKSGGTPAPDTLLLKPKKHSAI